MAGSTARDEGKCIAVDNVSGAVYVVGYARGSVNGQSFGGGEDILVLKYDVDGYLVWTKMIGSTEMEDATAVTVDAGGIVYVTGYTESSLSGQTNAGESDIFVIKMSGDGTTQWTRLAGTTGWDGGYGVAVENDGDVYVTGSVSGDLDGQTLIGGDSDIVLIKYSRNGLKVWARLAGSTNSDVGFGVALGLSAGTVYVTGTVLDSMGGMSFGGAYDIAVLMYDGDGTLVWSQQLGGSSDDVGYSVAVDQTSLAAYVSGYTAAGFLNGQTSEGEEDMLLLKLSSTGTVMWTRLAGSAGYDSADAVTVDSASGSVYVTGYAEDAVSGQPYMGGGDIVLIKYASNGTRIWVRMDGTSVFERGQGIALSNAGQLYITGYTVGNLHGITSQGLADLFYTRFTTSDAVSGTSDTVCQFRKFDVVGSQASFSRHRCVYTPN